MTGPARAERRDRQRVPSNNGAKAAPAAAASATDLVVDDDSSDDEDDDGPVMKDGTINASDRNPKPLRELLPIRSSASAVPSAASSSNVEHRVSGVPPPAKGPSRPLPPTPDDDDTMTRRGGAVVGNGGGASGGVIMNSNNSSSPAIRSNMPDLLPQTPSGGPPTPVSRGGGLSHEGHGAGPQQGSPLTGLQVGGSYDIGTYQTKQTVVDTVTSLEAGVFLFR